MTPHPDHHSTVHEQGTDSLTLRARFDLSFRVPHLFKNPEGRYELFDFKSNDDIVGGSPRDVPENVIKKILSSYFAIEEWLQRVEDPDSNRKLKSLVSLLKNNELETIDKLWLVLQDTELAEGIFGFWLSKSMIDDVNEKLKEAIFAFIEQEVPGKPGNEGKWLKVFMKHLEKEKNRSNDHRRQIGFTAFEDFKNQIPSIGHAKPKSLQSIITRINERYGFQLEINKSLRITNLDDFFWDKRIDIPTMIELDFKESLLSKLSGKSNTSPSSGTNEDEDKNSKKTYLEELEDWHHHQGHRPFIVRPLELMRWNYQLILSGFLGFQYNEETTRFIDLRRGAVKDLIIQLAKEGKFSGSLLNKIKAHITDEQGSEANVGESYSYLYNLSKATITHINKLWAKVYYEGFQKFLRHDEYLNIREDEKQIAFDEAFIEISSELLQKLSNGTFGKLLESSLERVSIDINHSIKGEIGLLSKAFRRRLGKIQEQEQIPINSVSIVSPNSNSKFKDRYLDFQGRFKELGYDDKCFLFWYENDINDLSVREIFDEYAPEIKEGKIYECIKRGRALALAYIIEEKDSFSEYSIHLEDYMEIIQNFPDKTHGINGMRLASQFLRSGLYEPKLFVNDNYWKTLLLKASRPPIPTEIEPLKKQAMIGLAYLEIHRMKDEKKAK